MTTLPAKVQRREANRRWFSFLRAIGLLIVLGSLNVVVANRVTVSMPAPGEVSVEAELSSPARSWSFRNVYAGILGLAERVENFRAAGAGGQAVEVKKSATGEFRSDLDATKISYTVKLANPRATDTSHTSWLVSDRGLLMFADLLPQDLETLSAEFALPNGWTVESSQARDAAGRFEVPEPVKAVFLIGTALRKTTHELDGMVYDVVISGKWPFKDETASKAVTQVMQKYLALTGYRLPNRSVVLITLTPMSMPRFKWGAEARGSTVVLVLDPKELGAWYEQLIIIFTHEILHLWVPNSLKLQGDYDWFFEGFTMYIAMCTALELKAIKFNGYLTTVAGAYDAYLANLDTDNLSLIEASERRWTTPFPMVNVKGILVAFLLDLITRRESGGKITLASRYRELFAGRVADDGDANKAIITLLGSTPATRELLKSYVENSGKIDLERVVPAFGLMVDPFGRPSNLRVSSGLTPEQKQLLRGLGYRD